MAYELNCTGCSFEKTMDEDRDLDEVFDVIEAHESTYQAAPTDHFVNFVATHAQANTA